MKIQLQQNSSSSTQKTNDRILSSRSRSRKLKESRKISFYREISALLEAGMDLHGSLSLIESGNPNDKNKFVSQIKFDVEKGAGLAEAFDKTALFSSFEVESIRAAEKAGMLSEVLENILLFFEYRQKLKRTITGALSYPVLLMFVAIGVIFFMLQVVVPMFEDIYRQMNRELPQITQILISSSKFVQDYGIVFLLTLILIVVGFSQLWKNESSRIRLEKLLMKLPLFGNFYKNLIKSRTTSLLQFLTQAYVPINEAIRHSADASTSKWLKKELEKTANAIEQGNRLSSTLGQLDLFSISERTLIQLGEETNRLGKSFSQITKSLMEKLEYESNVLNKVLEPFLIGIVALFIAVILIALYMPLFNVSF